jgi:hypothetical protein
MFRSPALGLRQSPAPLVFGAFVELLEVGQRRHSGQPLGSVDLTGGSHSQSVPAWPCRNPNA